MNEHIWHLLDHYNKNGWEVVCVVPAVYEPNHESVWRVVTRRNESPFGPNRVYQFSTVSQYGPSGHEYDLTYDEAMKLAIGGTIE